MPGLSDLMQYTPAGTGVMEGMKHGADVAQSQAAAGYSDAMANRTNMLAPFEAQEKEYQVKKLMEDYRRRPIEDQQKDNEVIKKNFDGFHNTVAELMVSGFSVEQAFNMVSQDNEVYAAVAKNHMSKPDVMQRFTLENAQQRLLANPQAAQAMAVQGLANQKPASVSIQDWQYYLSADAAGKAALERMWGLKHPPAVTPSSVTTSTERMTAGPNGPVLEKKVEKGPGGAPAPSAPPAPTGAGNQPAWSWGPAPTDKNGKPLADGKWKDANGTPFGVKGGWAYKLK